MPLYKMITDMQPKHRFGGLPPWPPFGGLIELTEDEARDMLSAGQVAPADSDFPDSGYRVLREADPEWDKRPDEAPANNSVTETEDADEAYSDDEDDDFDRAPAKQVPDPPRPGDPKSKWVSYAVETGSDPDVASGMTKAQLIALYKKL